MCIRDILCNWAARFKRLVLFGGPGTNATGAVSLHAGLSVDSSMDKRKLLRVVLPILAAVAAGVGWLMMEKPHRDVGGEVARHKMVPEELQRVLAEGGEAAAPYLDANLPSRRSAQRLGQVVTRGSSSRAAVQRLSHARARA